jgi:hypothetical protein
MDIMQSDTLDIVDLPTPVTLTTIGSRGVEIEISPSALAEASGGITLWFRYMVGTPIERRSAYTLTAEEAERLAVAITTGIKKQALTID